jgi:lipoate-protein ligase A
MQKSHENQTAHTPSQIEISEYPGDAIIVNKLASEGSSLTWELWEEQQVCVVLGRSCQVEREVIGERLLTDNISVYRRMGGGGTVVLAPGMLIIAIAAYTRDPYASKRYFQLIQQPIVEALQLEGITEVAQRGISDIAWRERKLLGSSMRRQKSLLLYQGVLLIDTPRQLFERYLQHPPREPDYRARRDHSSFTISMRELGYISNVAQFKQTLHNTMLQRLPQLLDEELVPRPSEILMEIKTPKPAAP